MEGRRPASTFSIVALDPHSQSLGVAVASKFLAVGSAVPWARAGVGAIATQAWANTSFGPVGLELLARGLTVEEVGRRLLAGDEGRERRQVGIVDARGQAFAHTGSACLEWAGHVTGPHFCCQGNLLAGPGVVEAMAEAFQAATGDLPARLLAALAAGEKAGGDRRGRQSAAILVVREGAGYGGFSDRYMDLRVDDHPDPVGELHRLVALFRLYFEKEAEPRWLPLEGPVLEQVQQALARLGYLPAPTGRLDEATRQALHRFHGVENFEEREHPAGSAIQAPVLALLRQKAELAAPPAAPPSGA